MLFGDAKNMIFDSFGTLKKHLIVAIQSQNAIWGCKNRDFGSFLRYPNAPNPYYNNDLVLLGAAKHMFPSLGAPKSTKSLLHKCLKRLRFMQKGAIFGTPKSTESLLYKGQMVPEAPKWSPKTRTHKSLLKKRCRKTLFL